MDIFLELKKTKEQTLPYFDLEDGELQKTYAAGKWTIREILHHLADAETVLYERIRRGISEKNLVVWGFDQDAWCKQLDYNTQDLSVNKSIYAAIREGNIDLAKRFYKSKGSTSYVHNEVGMRTLKEEIDKVAKHNIHHLKQIEKALNN